MPDDSRAQADLAGREIASKTPVPAPIPGTTDSPQEITEIARKLAAHGGGAASLDLAFDLVLHEIVQQARAVSGATGAAIALSRDGKMVCRATSGENAPDLGVSVEAGSRLTGICLTTGVIQHSRDTESDARVESETCRRLGVRSMLLIPLVDGDGTFGVLQLFSSLPNAFGDQEIATLLRLADRVSENRTLTLQSPKPAAGPDDVQGFLPEQLQSKKSTDGERAPQNPVPSESAVGRSSEIWTGGLFLLVIITAIALGIVVGWSNGRKATPTPRVVPQSNAVSAERDQVPTNTSVPDAASASPGRVDPSSNVHNQAKSVVVPVGSLVVTENGKVIYRSPEDSGNPSLKPFVGQPDARELMHRVEPDYPPKARAQHIEGMVILELEIAGDGSIANTAVVSGNPLLASAAVQAVRQWHYRPDPGGASRTRVTLQFTLPVN